MLYANEIMYMKRYPSIYLPDHRTNYSIQYYCRILNATINKLYLNQCIHLAIKMITNDRIAIMGYYMIKIFIIICTVVL